MTTLYLLASPTIYQRLYLECKEANVSYNSIISQHEAQSLPYLQATIMEGLRMFPAATGLQPHIAPPTGDTLEDGTYIPPGTQVGLASWLIYHNKDVFGDDADIFRPERWIDEPDDRIITMKKTMELLFSYGRFKCLGQKVAMIELPKVIFELVRRFDFALDDPLRPMEKSVCYGLFLQKGMWVRVRRREEWARETVSER